MTQPSTPAEAIRSAVARQKVQADAMKIEAQRIAQEREEEAARRAQETAGQ